MTTLRNPGADRAPPAGGAAGLVAARAAAGVVARVVARVAAGVTAVLLAAAAATLAPAPASAEPARSGTTSPWIEGYNSRVRLLAGHDAGAPGRPLHAGIEIETRPDWKTYWRNPGDAGVPPSFDWSKSDNVASVKVGYPPPRRLVDKGGTTIGYLGRVVFPAVVTPVDPARPVALRLAVEYGVCKDICVPAQAEPRLDVPAGAALAMPAELAAALAELPRPRGQERAGDPVVREIRVELRGASPHIAFEALLPPGAGGEADAFLVADDGGFIPLPERLPEAAGEGDRRVVRFRVDLTKDVDVRDLAGKTVHATITGPGGASEVQIPIR